MRQLFMAAICIAAAGALASCDPTVLAVKDNSALERITIEVSNDSPKWEYGEERIFTIVPSPKTAICERFELRFSNPELVILKAGEMPNQFKVTAAGEGKLIVTAAAVGHGEIAGQAGNDWPVEKTVTEEFQLVDSRVKPQRPLVTLQMAANTDLSKKKELAEDTPATIDDTQELLLTVTSDSERATYSIKSLDNEVFNVERTGAQSWMLKTKKPGRDFLKLTVKDAEQNEFDYYYLIYTYGHVTMTAEYDPLMAEGGISICEHDYQSLTAQVYMAGILRGWPWNDVNNVVERELPTYTGALDFTEALEYKSLINTYDLQREIQNMTVGTGQDKAWFNIHEVRLNYIITLSNPFIIIDDLTDDNDREESLWWGFRIEGALQQEGVEPVMMLSHDSIGFDATVDGWKEGTK